jgi:hypothetical protein
LPIAQLLIVEFDNLMSMLYEPADASCNISEKSPATLSDFPVMFTEHGKVGAFEETEYINSHFQTGTSISF